MCVSRSCRFSAAIDLMCVAVQRFMEAVSHMGTFSRAEEVLDTMLAAVRCVARSVGAGCLSTRSRGDVPFARSEGGLTSAYASELFQATASPSPAVAVPDDSTEPPSPAATTAAVAEVLCAPALASSGADIVVDASPAQALAVAVRDALAAASKCEGQLAAVEPSDDSRVAVRHQVALESTVAAAALQLWQVGSVVGCVLDYVRDGSGDASGGANAAAIDALETLAADQRVAFGAMMELRQLAGMATAATSAGDAAGGSVGFTTSLGATTSDARCTLPGDAALLPAPVLVPGTAAHAALMAQLRRIVASSSAVCDAMLRAVLDTKASDGSSADAELLAALKPDLGRDEAATQALVARAVGSGDTDAGLQPWHNQLVDITRACRAAVDQCLAAKREGHGSSSGAGAGAGAGAGVGNTSEHARPAWAVRATDVCTRLRDASTVQQRLDDASQQLASATTVCALRARCCAVLCCRAHRAADVCVPCGGCRPSLRRRRRWLRWKHGVRCWSSG